MNKQNTICPDSAAVRALSAGVAFQIYETCRTVQAQQYLAKATQLIAADQYDTAFKLAQEAAVLRPHEAQNILAQLSTLRRSQKNYLPLTLSNANHPALVLAH